MAPSASITRTEETQQNATLSRRPCQLEFWVTELRWEHGTRVARLPFEAPFRCRSCRGFWRGHRKTDDV